MRYLHFNTLPAAARVWTYPWQIRNNTVSVCTYLLTLHSPASQLTKHKHLISTPHNNLNFQQSWIPWSNTWNYNKCLSIHKFVHQSWMLGSWMDVTQFSYHSHSGRRYCKIPLLCHYMPAKCPNLWMKMCGWEGWWWGRWMKGNERE